MNFLLTVFGFGTSYPVLLVARSLQGVSSSFTTIIGKENSHLML